MGPAGSTDSGVLRDEARVIEEQAGVKGGSRRRLEWGPMIAVQGAHQLVSRVRPTLAGADFYLCDPMLCGGE